MSKKSLINVALIVALFLVFGISFVIGGLVSSTLLTLVLLPILYRRFSIPARKVAS